jgi:uncharacterized damage-inducible protein DinB
LCARESLFPYDVRDDEGKLSAVSDVRLEDHLYRLDAARAVLLGSLQRMTIEEFRRQRRLATYDVTPEWVLYHLSQHEAEHRGQILELRDRAQQALQV